MLENALIMAAAAHTGQETADGRPYILHPLHVAAQFDDLTLKVVAILHDVVEDGDVDLGRIHHDFGASVAHAVDALSRRDEEKYFQFIDRLAKNHLARAVKIADIRHNMDLTRVPHLDRNDDWPLKRTARYHRALRTLERADGRCECGRKLTVTKTCEVCDRDE
jgi:(p)ppGpp synthase/HD superfamily hydrolase